MSRKPKPAEEMRRDVAEHIALTLGNPIMWVGDESHKAASGVDVVLASLCLLWATIEGRPRAYHKASNRMLEAAGCVDYSAEPSGLVRCRPEDTYRAANPDATEREVIAHVVKLWRAVAEELNVPLTDNGNKISNP